MSSLNINSSNKAILLVVVINLALLRMFG